jgi:hypothetical protein
VRKMMRQLLFMTDKRALATSMGADPDAVESDSPKRLTSGGALTATPPRKKGDISTRRILPNVEDDEGDVDPTVDLERDLMEVKLAHDKLLVKLEAIEKLVLSESKGNNRARVRLQSQVYFLIVMIMIVMGVLIREKIVNTPSSLGGLM